MQFWLLLVLVTRVKYIACWFTELSPVEEKEKEKDHPDGAQVKHPPAVVEPATSPTERSSRTHTRVHKSASASALTLLIPPHGAFCAISLK